MRASARRHVAPSGTMPRAESERSIAAPIGEALLSAGLIDRDTLDWAIARQVETGERLGQILLAAQRIHRLDLQRVLGEQWQLQFIDLLSTEVDEALVRGCDPELLLTEGWIPVRREGNRVLVAVCEPPTDEFVGRVRASLGAEAQIELRTTTPVDIERTILRCFHEHIVRRSTSELLARRPDLSAAAGFSRGQRRWLLALAVLSAIGMAVSWQFTSSSWRASSASRAARALPSPRPSATIAGCRFTRCSCRCTARRT
jgi:hypothetical protein